MLEAEIPLTTDEGYQYLIVFKEFQNIPRDYGLTIINVSIILMDDISPNNSLKTLFKFSHIILEYLENHNVILYYYCDVAPINIRKNRKMNITPQEFRSNLFSKMFEKINSSDYVEKPVIIEDIENGDHYVSLICHKNNYKVVKEIEMDIISLSEK